MPTKDNQNEKLPLVSWNELSSQGAKWSNTVLSNIKENSDMYFVHSFVAEPKNNSDVLSITEYSNYKFCSSVKKGNIYGCQFHPEKSGEIGLSVIKNFIGICKK